MTPVAPPNNSFDAFFLFQHDFFDLILMDIGLGIIAISLLFLLYRSKLIHRAALWLKRTKLADRIALGVITVGVLIFLYSAPNYPIQFAMPPMMHAMTPDEAHLPPYMPVVNVWRFFLHGDHFKWESDISQDPANVPPPITRQNNEVVKVHFTMEEVFAELAPGIINNYWAYDGQVPGPMIRVKEGDTIQFSLSNDPSSLHAHNIDMHAVSGPGGGAPLTTVSPGQTKTFTWKALHPGLYIYHCATPNIALHETHGQYGLVLVEPKDHPLPKVDKEFYLVQGEFYTAGGIGRKGLVKFDSDRFIDGNPTYVVFNGKIETTPRMVVNKGDHVRIYVGNGGVNLISSFHIIGVIFDTVYPEGAIGPGSAVEHNVQTTAILPGGAAIVEFTANVPGTFLVVDHALARLNKGAWAQLVVKGSPSPDIYHAGPADAPISASSPTPMPMHH